MTDKTTLYRVQVELTNGDTYTIDDQTADSAEETVRRFLHGVGDGLTFAVAWGVLSWPWDEIRGVGLIRMVALSDIEMQPHLQRTLTAIDSPEKEQHV